MERFPEHLHERLFDAALRMRLVHRPTLPEQAAHALAWKQPKDWRRSLPVIQEQPRSPGLRLQPRHMQRSCSCTYRVVAVPARGQFKDTRFVAKQDQVNIVGA